MSFLAAARDVLSRTRLRVWLVGVAVAVLGTGIWGVVTQGVGVRVTECGFDSHGAYARVRVNNLLGGAHEQDVNVVFYAGHSPDTYGGHNPNVYGIASTTVMVPAHGRGTAVLHGRFPPNGTIDGSPGNDAHVAGRTVYRYGERLVSKRFAEKQRGAISVETVPDDPSILHCWIGDNGT